MAYYHGSTSALGITHILAPVSETGNLSEVGRKRNLDRVFFTKDLGLAKIYAAKAAKRFGGVPCLYRVVSPVGTQCLDSRPGASVFHCAWAFCEAI